MLQKAELLAVLRRRGGRAAEGDGLLNRCRGSTPTVGSNPIPSANPLIASFRQRSDNQKKFQNFRDFLIHLIRQFPLASTLVREVY